MNVSITVLDVWFIFGEIQRDCTSETVASLKSEQNYQVEQPGRKETSRASK